MKTTFTRKLSIKKETLTKLDAPSIDTVLGKSKLAAQATTIESIVTCTGTWISCCTDPLICTTVLESTGCPETTTCPGSDIGCESTNCW